MTISVKHHERQVRADVLLVRNIRSLLDARRIDDKALAEWCGHRAPWLSKVMLQERGIRLKDVGKIADFFGLTIAELFSFGISHSFERRHTNRRSGKDRRVNAHDRRRSTG